MKHLKIKIALSLLAIMATVFTVNAQEDDPAAVKKWVDSKNFVFKAQQANPTGGRTRQLTAEYDLVVRPDSVVAFLPYFGRAFTAPIGTDGGIKFTSTDFSYNLVKQKKNSWEIELKTRDVTDNNQLNLTIFSNGRASLRVNSNNRQPISFEGYLVEGRPFERKAF